MTGQTLVLFFKAIEAWQMSVKSLCDANPGQSTVRDESSEAGFKEIMLDNVHWEALIKGLAIHLDDINPAIQVIRVYL